MTRELTDSCSVLPLYDLCRKGLLRDGRLTCASVTWPSGSSIVVTADLRGAACPVLTLRYQWSLRGSGDGPRTEVVPVALARTAQRLGGWRWWFLCPLHCGRRAAKLFLCGVGEHAGWFACRRCHDLDYRSHRESGQGDAVLARIAANAGATLAEARRALRPPRARPKPRVRWSEFRQLATPEKKDGAPRP